MTKYPNATPSRKNSRRGLVLVAAATMIAVVGGIVNNSAYCVHAFQPAGRSSRSSWSSDGGVIATTRFRTRDNHAVTQLQVVPPDLFTGGGGGVSTAVVPDLHDVATHVQAVQGYVQTTWEHGVPANTMWLSQATNTATEGFDLDSFEETQAAILKDKGWWEAYLNIFKTWIEVIHTTIDAPIHKYTGWQGGTWGFSIALFTASVRSLLIPLSIQQSKATEMNKAIQPYVKTINEKFKNDDNRKNQAIGKLYEDSKQNPLSGCLLSLVQLPIILGLYRGVRLLALDGKLDEQFLWIPSLEGPVTAATDYRGLDWLVKGWTQIEGTWTPSLGWETTLAFCVMPVVLVLGQKLTMEVLAPPDMNAGTEEKDEADMTPDEIKAKSSEDSTKIVLKLLPLLIGFFSLQVPAGLTIYWFTSNFFTLAQAVGVRKYYEANPPQIELPDYWDALDDLDETKSPEERRAAAKAGLAKGPSMDDWITKANFHTLVEREPLRETSSSWQRLVQAAADADAGATGHDGSTAPHLVVPEEFQAWVASSHHSVENESTTTAETAPTTTQPVL